MTKLGATPILASYATLKGLNDTNGYNNSYQILSEFIGYIIENEKLFTFSAVEVKNHLKTSFSFSIPEAVIRTALKKLPYITLSDGMFTADRTKIVYNKSFEDIKASSEAANTGIIDLLSSYIREKEPEREVVQEALEQDLITFLVDDLEKSSGRYTTQIGTFILKNKHNTDVQKSLKAIQEGSILFIGLNYNINETGSLKKDLTLFLGTEVLFGLAGYNGEIHKQLATDLFDLIRSANLNGKKINLRYFSEVKKEIENFFGSAESIADGKTLNFDNVAMRAILNGCENSNDVLDKKSDFYHILKYSYGITEDDKNDYYAEKYFPYNLESDVHTDPKIQSSWAFVSHINKLRKGVVFSNNTDSEFLIVTNTRTVLNASKEQTEINKSAQDLEYANDYAVSINRMTNLLWYKLGKGFGSNAYPSNVDAVLKAQTILAASISSSISKTFDNANRDYKEGKVTKEQFAARIVMLKNKPMLPEDLEGDSIEEIMDFSPEYISRFEEEVNSNKAALKEKDEEIRRIEENSSRMLSQKDSEILQKDELLKQEAEEKRAIESELSMYRQQEQQQALKKDKKEKLSKFILSVSWKVVIVAVLVVLAVFLEKRFESNIPMYICAAVSFLGIVFPIRASILKDYHKYFPKSEDGGRNQPFVSK